MRGPMAVDADASGEPGLLLAGDASGFIDPMTGDGLRLALAGAELAAAVTLNVLAGRVTSVAPSSNGAQADVRLDCSGATLMARLTAKSVNRLALAPGRPVFAVIKSVSFERS